MTPMPYTLDLPADRNTCVVFSSPHSGRDYPADFLARSVLDTWAIRSSEDAFVDRLFSAAPLFGAPLLVAHAPRAFIDLNRAADELDPAVVEGVPRPLHNPRVSSGLGVIPRVVANGRAIYRGRITRIEAEARIARHWRPYHARLAALVEESLGLYGQAILIDCHSMPHEAVESASLARTGRPEVVLGDRFGAAAAPWVVEPVEQAFRDAGFRVARNAPFAGAYITQAYGRPSRGVHAIQIEIDRALYLDEAGMRPGPGFETLKAALSGVIAEIARIGRHEDRAPLAAE